MAEGKRRCLVYVVEEKEEHLFFRNFEGKIGFYQNNKAQQHESLRRKKKERKVLHPKETYPDAHCELNP